MSCGLCGAPGARLPKRAEIVDSVDTEAELACAAARKADALAVGDDAALGAAVRELEAVQTKIEQSKPQEAKLYWHSPHRSQVPFQCMPSPKRLVFSSEVRRSSFRAPQELMAQAVLGAMSATVQGNVSVRHLDYLAPTSLYLMTAAPPGESKSPVFKAAFAPIYDWEKARTEASRKLSARPPVQQRWA